MASKTDSSANPSKTSKSIGCGCNLDDEISKEDQLILDQLNLTEEQLKLKEANIDEFWKSIAETVRSNLSDSLEDNQEVNSSMKIKYPANILFST